MGKQNHEYDRIDRQSCRLAPLNVPLVIIADDPLLLDAARTVVAAWPGGAPDAGAPLAIELRLGTDAAWGVSCRAEVEGSRLTVTGGGICGWADAVAGRAAASIPAEIAQDPARLGGMALETLLLFLLARRGRTPIHASGVVVCDQAFALCGPSGSGKSTLALAAARRGLGVLSEDTLYVQTEPGLRVWGLPGPAHLLPGDAPSGAHATRERAGKVKLVVPLGASHPPCAERAVPVLLARGEAVSLEPLTPDIALRELMALDPGFDLLHAESERAFRALLAGGAWRLTLGRDPGEAIDRLAGQLAEVA